MMNDKTGSEHHDKDLEMAKSSSNHVRSSGCGRIALKCCFRQHGGNGSVGGFCSSSSCVEDATLVLAVA